MTPCRAFLALTLLVSVQACELESPPGMARGAQLFDTCAPCHGDAGAGNPQINAPAIAGLPHWYVEDQLGAFQDSWRGMHANDLAGLRMRPMAVTLNREGDISSVAEYVSSLQPVFPPSTLSGNAGAGADLYAAVCASCHGTDALGNETLRAPPLVSLDDWYLLGELEDYRMGARGAHPEDIWGATMRTNSVALTDRAMRDAVAYIQTLR